MVNTQPSDRPSRARASTRRTGRRALTGLIRTRHRHTILRHPTGRPFAHPPPRCLLLYYYCYLHGPLCVAILPARGSGCVRTAGCCVYCYRLDFLPSVEKEEQGSRAAALYGTVVRVETEIKGNITQDVGG